MTLQTDTKDLHHACEQHSVGAAMSRGDVSDQVWTDWLGSLYVIHQILDCHLPQELHRADKILLDMRSMSDCRPRLNIAAIKYASTLMDDPDTIAAATYVFTGAHLMGGAVMERRLGERLPCEHLRWDNRRTSLDTWRPYRERQGISAQARAAFAAILEMMDEIESP